MAVSEAQREMFRKRVQLIDSAIPGYAQVWQSWEKRLLSAGGDAVVALEQPEVLLTRLLERAKLTVCRRGKGVTMMTGQRSACHQNVATLWSASPDHLDLVAIGTGYALSADGLWRQHSWAITTGGLIETTSVREAYMGIELRGGEADRFAVGNR